MALAAGSALASYARECGLREDAVLPRMDDIEVPAREAVAVGMKAQEQGIARLEATAEELHARTVARVRAAREATAVLMKEGLISLP